MIAFVTDNTADITPIVCAALCLGCSIAAQPPCHSTTEYSHFLNMLKPTFVLCDLKCYATLKDCLVNLNNQAQVFTFNGQMNDSHSVDDLFHGSDDESYFV